MTIEEALKEICEKQVPKEINGISTEYNIREYSSNLGNKVVEVSILPTNIPKNDISVTQKHFGYYNSYDYCRADLAYLMLIKDVWNLLCEYIHNIIEWTEGEVVREIRLDLESDINDL